jgi:hypothetical protein
MLHVTRGTTIQDVTVQVKGTVDPLNVLLGDVTYSSPDPFSNAMGDNLENITVSVTDTTATYQFLKDGGWFQSQEPARYTGTAKTAIRIVPRKYRPLGLDMVPVYAEPWARNSTNVILLQ